MSQPELSTVPAKHPNPRFASGVTGAETVAMGLPRLVMSSDLPEVRTSSRTDKHLALNSEMFISSMPLTVLDHFNMVK